MPIPPSERDWAEVLIARFCESRVPERVTHQLELSYRFDGNNLFLVERRPGLRRRGQWTELDVAKFRYMVGRKEWVLYWSDRNERWHRCDWRAPARRLATLLKEVDADPTCIFWG